MNKFGGLKATGHSVIEPHAGGTAEAFRRIGYDVQVALADLVDNSVDAKATTVLIRFVRTDDTIRSLLVADNGEGMTSDTIEEAMRWGKRMSHRSQDLGKFGVGLKAASFSQCKSVSVASRRAGLTTGRRWTLASIKQGWKCEHLESDSTAVLMDLPYQGIDMNAHGTLVLWEDLDHLPRDQKGVSKRLDKLTREIANHLGLVFHRFLDSGRLAILIDCHNIESNETASPIPVYGLDPFSYSRSGKKGYPHKMELRMSGLPPIAMRAHIWPPRSKDPGFTLGGGKVAARQGFYFYRNDRLIQSGGWNAWRVNEAEPHLSLARVEINLSPEFDAEFQLDVQKTSLNLPPEFFEALGEVRNESKSFASYITDAEGVYRSGKQEELKTTYVPGRGFPAPSKGRVRWALAGRGSHVQHVPIVWRRMDEESVLDFDHENQTIIVNRAYRDWLDDAAHVDELPLLKALIFSVLHDEFGRQRKSRPSAERIARLNKILLAVLVSGEL